MQRILRCFGATPQPLVRGSIPFPSIQAHLIHIKRVPFTGPPSCASTTISRCLSDQSNPVMFLGNKYRDVRNVDPRDIDVFLTEVSDMKLRSEVAAMAGVPYLGEASKDEADKVMETCEGFVYGQYRTILPCVVGLGDQARWVFFVVDSSAPATYLSVPAAEAFGITRSPVPATIAGYRQQVYLSPRDSHFAEINLLGADFYNITGLNYWTNHEKGTVKFYFGNQWVVNRAA